MKLLPKLTLIVAVFGLASAPAFAGSARFVQKQEVDLSKYDMSTKQGVVDAYRALEKASIKVCHVQRNFETRIDRIDELRCRQRALFKAVAKTRSAQLAQFHRDAREG